MNPVVIGLVGAVLGGFLGFSTGMLACFFPQVGELCGLIGMLITGPIGIVVGAVIAIRGERKYQRRIDPNRRP
jgi:hypothetical protein